MAQQMPTATSSGSGVLPSSVGLIGAEPAAAWGHTGGLCSASPPGHRPSPGTPPLCPPLGYLLGWLRGGCVLIAPGCSACNGGGTRGW